VSIVLFDQRPHAPDAGKGHFVEVSAVVGGLVGLILGAAVQAFFFRGRVAFRLLREAVANYRLDLVQLERLATDYGPTVERAVREVRDQ
jgi:hypothetical protein